MVVDPEPVWWLQVVADVVTDMTAPILPGGLPPMGPLIWRWLSNYLTLVNQLVGKKVKEDTFDSKILISEPLTLYMSCTILLCGLTKFSSLEKLFTMMANNSDCSICLIPHVYQDQNVLQLYCGHEFLSDCVNKCVKNSKLKCSICQSPGMEQPAWILWNYYHHNW